MWINRHSPQAVHHPLPLPQTLRDGLESEISSGVGRQMQLQERLKKATELRVPSDHPVRVRD